MIDTDLQLLQSWFNANKLSLNVEKTVAMKFWDDKEDFHVSVNGWKIPLVRSTKFLGGVYGQYALLAPPYKPYKNHIKTQQQQKTASTG